MHVPTTHLPLDSLIDTPFVQRSIFSMVRQTPKLYDGSADEHKGQNGTCFGVSACVVNIHYFCSVASVLDRIAPRF